MTANLRPSAITLNQTNLVTKANGADQSSPADSRSQSLLHPHPNPPSPLYVSHFTLSVHPQDISSEMDIITILPTSPSIINNEPRSLTATSPTPHPASSPPYLTHHPPPCLLQQSQLPMVEFVLSEMDWEGAVGFVCGEAGEEGEVREVRDSGGMKPRAAGRLRTPEGCSREEIVGVLYKDWEQ